MEKRERRREASENDERRIKGISEASRLGEAADLGDTAAGIGGEDSSADIRDLKKTLNAGGLGSSPDQPNQIPTDSPRHVLS